MSQAAPHTDYWRGRVDEKLAEHDRHFDALNGHIRRSANELVADAATVGAAAAAGAVSALVQLLP